MLDNGSDMIARVAFAFSQGTRRVITHTIVAIINLQLTLVSSQVKPTFITTITHYDYTKHGGVTSIVDFRIHPWAIVSSSCAKSHLSLLFVGAQYAKTQRSPSFDRTSCMTILMSVGGKPGTQARLRWQLDCCFDMVKAHIDAIHSPVISSIALLSSVSKPPLRRNDHNAAYSGTGGAYVPIITHGLFNS